MTETTIRLSRKDLKNTSGNCFQSSEIKSSFQRPDNYLAYLPDPKPFQNLRFRIFQIFTIFTFLVCLFVKFYFFYIFCLKQFLYFCKNLSFAFSEFVNLVSLTNVLKNSEIVTCSSDCCTKPESKNSHFFHEN